MTVPAHVGDEQQLACAGMSQLETIDLGWCSSVTDLDLKTLAELPLLREIDLSRTLVRTSCACGVFTQSLITP